MLINRLNLNIFNWSVFLEMKQGRGRNCEGKNKKNKGKERKQEGKNEWNEQKPNKGRGKNYAEWKQMNE